MYLGWFFCTVAYSRADIETATELIDHCSYVVFAEEGDYLFGYMHFSEPRDKEYVRDLLPDTYGVFESDSETSSAVLFVKRAYGWTEYGTIPEGVVDSVV